MFKHGQKVRFKTKEALIAEFGVDKYGHPKTYVAFNNDGEMDHLYGSTGTVIPFEYHKQTELIDFVNVKFDNEIEVKSYFWAISATMLEAY